MGIRQYLEEHRVCLLFPKEQLQKMAAALEVSDCQRAMKFIPAENGSFGNPRQQNGMRAGGASTCNPACPVGKGNPLQRKAGMEESQQSSLAQTLPTQLLESFPVHQHEDHLGK